MALHPLTKVCVWSTCFNCFWMLNSCMLDVCISGFGISVLRITRFVMSDVGMSDLWTSGCGIQRSANTTHMHYVCTTLITCGVSPRLGDICIFFIYMYSRALHPLTKVRGRHACNCFWMLSSCVLDVCISQFGMSAFWIAEFVMSRTSDFGISDSRIQQFANTTYAQCIHHS